jgi:hypothetical protein
MLGLHSLLIAIATRILSVRPHAQGEVAFVNRPTNTSMGLAMFVGMRRLSRHRSISCKA